MSNEAVPSARAYFPDTEISVPPPEGPTGDPGSNANPSGEAKGAHNAIADVEVDREFLNRIDESRDIKEVIDEAAMWNGGNPLFLSRADKVSGPLDAGYRLYVRLLKDSQAVEDVLSHKVFPNRQRLPSRNNPAHIALLLVAKAQEGAERKLCSAYAKVLKCAAKHGIDPADFVAEMTKSGVSLESCTADIQGREPRKRSTAQKSEPPTGSDTAPQANVEEAGAVDEAAGSPPGAGSPEATSAPVVLHPGEWLMLRRGADGMFDAMLCTVQQTTAVPNQHSLAVRHVQVAPALREPLAGLFDQPAGDGDHRAESPAAPDPA